MSMLAGQVDFVIGVDTHRDTNTTAVVDAATIRVMPIPSAPPTRWAFSERSVCPASRRGAVGLDDRGNRQLRHRADHLLA
jgi:hypothetical protein